MRVESASDRVALRKQLLAELLQEKGIHRYGIFGASAEGKPWPNGAESGSGFVVTGDGRVFFYWLDWSDEEARPVFTGWRSVTPDDEWSDDEEYLSARRAAGAA